MELPMDMMTRVMMRNVKLVAKAQAMAPSAEECHSDEVELLASDHVGDFAERNHEGADGEGLCDY